MLQPNTLYFSALLKEVFPPIAREITTKLKKHGIKPHWLDFTNDIWARDYMPLQISENHFVHYTYYPDYLLRSLEDRASITNPIKLEQRLLAAKGKTIDYIPLIMDGGNAILTDKHIIMTEKVLFENHLSDNKKENKTAISALIKQTVKREPIFIRWDAMEWNQHSKTERYGHTDWVVRYAGGPQHTLIIGENEEKTQKVSESAKQALTSTQQYDIQTFKLNNCTRNSWAYLNYVQVKNVVLMPTVNEEASDIEAQEKLYRILKQAGQDIVIETIDCQDLIKQGGALNCISWNIYL